ncbi:MAG: acyltransferase [Bacteroidia bacterium]|nr:acyltransferase [Bacteroidia bacterium]
MNGFTSVYEFQSQIMHKVIRSIINQSSDGLTYEGFENIDRSSAYLFITNHRDIVLDSGILQILLHENNFETSEITFGSNLMQNQFIVDIGKLNKMFKVSRGETGREFYINSKRLSSYIRYTITQKKQSVWIAQRNGRTKDGNDKTETGLLKMLNVSGTGDFINNFKELQLVPVTTSYEYEPCDILKTREVYLSAKGPYQKSPNEDLNSILTGVKEYKGRIHFVIGKPINNELNRLEGTNENEKYKQLGLLIDKFIYSKYKLYPTNYIAYDLLYNCKKYMQHYTPTLKTEFENYAEKKLESLKELGNMHELRSIFLGIYANPVLNKEKQE